MYKLLNFCSSFCGQTSRNRSDALRNGNLEFLKFEKSKHFKCTGSFLMTFLGIRDIDKIGNWKAIQTVPFLGVWTDDLLLLQLLFLS